MKEDSKKQRQIAVLIQREMSTILRGSGQFIYGSEPMVTVTRVRMTTDLALAYVYVSVYGAEDKEQVREELTASLSHLRGELGKRIRLQVRHIPNLKFFLDDTLDQVEHIDSLFQQLNNTGSSMRSMKQAMEEQEDENNH